MRDELEQHVGRRRQRCAAGELFAQRSIADRKIRRRVDRGDHRLHQIRIVGGNYAEGIARRRNRDRCRRDRYRYAKFPFASLACSSAGATGTSQRPDCRAIGRAARPVRAPARGIAAGRRAGSARRRALKLGIKLLEHASGFLAARHAKIETLLRLREQSRRIVLAIVAALAAILLRHRRHQPARQRPPLGERHAIRQRHRRIVPGCAVVNLDGFRRRGIANKAGQAASPRRRRRAA